MNQEKEIDVISVIVEIPKGSRNKYEMDEARGRMKLDRMLYSSVHYPCDYGYVERTIALDNDPLDALVLLWEPTFPGCLIDARPIGMFMMTDEKGQDEKILCVPVSDPLWNHITDLSEIPPHLLKEIGHFFSSYKTLEQKHVEVEGWRSKEDAVQSVRDSYARYEERRKKMEWV